jgi:hypothetical protein
VGKILRINLAFARSSLFLVHFSSADRDGSARALDREASSPLVDDACRPVDNPLSDMTLSVIKSRSTFVTNSSTVVSSLNIRARN